jgi:hypothetical protein
MHKIVNALAFITLTATTAAFAEKVFIEPKNDVEWKSFCQAPDYLKQVKAITDKKEQQRISGTCLRAPWQKFKNSDPKSF